MSAQSRRADRAEERAAKALGVERIGGRQKRKRVPDLAPIRLSDGRLVQPEVKSRLRPPKFFTDGLAQAARYSPGAIPLLVVYQKGKRTAFAVLALDVLLEIMGLRDPLTATQLSLALGGAR